MSKFGERLRETRESQGISLAQAAIETHILQQSLIALEEGTFDRLPNDVVVKGFIRIYAQFLGLPPNEMIDLYRHERNNGTTTIRVVPSTSLVRKRSYVLPGFFGVFFVTIALVGLTYVVLSATGDIGNASHIASQWQARTETIPTPTPFPRLSPTARSNPETAIAEAEPEPISADHENHALDTPPVPFGPADPFPIPTPTMPLVAGVAVASPTPTSLPMAPSTMVLPAAPASPTPDVPMVVNVSIQPESADSWLRVTVDGTIVYEQIMQAGEREVFRVQRHIHLRAGNPPSVEVSVNGSAPEPLGSVPGNPVNWSWPPE
ncbi:MAG: helix-turn-helix domain-containing protein [Chloroflexaceae bacterium]|nr:helix-turn-helix domain-containing protein [Chloroflexaceae bacterium]